VLKLPKASTGIKTSSCLRRRNSQFIMEFKSPRRFMRLSSRKMRASFRRNCDWRCMVRAFLSIITIIYHPSSIIIFGITSIGQKRRFGDYFFRDKGVLRETFFFFSLLTLFCTFCLFFVFMQLIFNTWFSPFFTHSQRDGPRMWFPFSVFYTKIHFQ